MNDFDQNVRFRQFEAELDRIREEITDSFDEELELQFEDDQLEALAEEGVMNPEDVARAIKQYGLDPAKPNPLTV